MADDKPVKITPEARLTYVNEEYEMGFLVSTPAPLKVPVDRAGLEDIEPDRKRA